MTVAFLDSCCLIYLLEGQQELRQRTLSALEELKGPVRYAVSRLSWMECRVAPLRLRNFELLKRYDVFFDRSDLMIVELGKDVLEGATALRVKHDHLKTPDALQLASSLTLSGPVVFFTNDKRLKKITDLEIKIV